MFQVLTIGNDFKFPLFLFCIACLLLTFLFYTPAEAQRDENTVAGTWTFDDGTANDTSSQKLNGVVVGAPESVSIGVNLRKSRHVFHRKVLLSGNTSYIM